MVKVENLGAIVSPGSAKKDKKSGWRTFKPVVSDKCTGCSLCANACPEGGIVIKEKNGKRKAEINYDYCKGCLICVEACPIKAIKLEDRRKEK